MTTMQPVLLPRSPWRPGTTTAMCAGLVLAVGCSKADAAALNSVATSVGFFVAIAALLFTQAWPTNPAAAGVTAVVLVLAAGALLWRARGAALTRPAWLSPRPAASRPVCRSLARAAIVLPPELDRDELLARLRSQFVRLQAAWDRRELDVLRALTTPDMLAELCVHLSEACAEPNRTDVMTLCAELVGFDELDAGYLASVEFSGMIRECADGGATPFRELWMLARTREEGADWRLARQLDLP